MGSSSNRELDHFPRLSGRMNRGEYWACMIGSMLGFVFFGETADRMRLGGWALLFLAVTFGYTLFWGTFRRAHDLGWWGIVGIIPPMPLLLLFIPGDENANPYGPPPHLDEVPTQVPVDQPIPEEMNKPDLLNNKRPHGR